MIEPAERRLVLALTAVVALCYLWAFPYFRGIKHANELPRIYLARAIVLERSFRVDRGVAEDGATADLSIKDGHYYANKAPGVSMLGAPFEALLRVAYLGRPVPVFVETWWLRLWCSIVPAILAAPLFYRLLRHWELAPKAALGTTALFALGSGGTPYAVQLMAHHLAGVLLLGALACGELGSSRKAAAGAGALLGASVLVEYQAAFFGFPLGIYLLWRMRRAAFAPRGRLDHPWAFAALGALPLLSLLLGYHAACFGSPFRTGYDFAATAAFAAGHGKGLLGLERPELERLIGSLVGARTGLLTVTPALVLLPLGLALAARTRRALALTLGASAVVALGFAAGYHFWDTGWTVGQRYVAAATPLLILPIGFVLDRVLCPPARLRPLAPVLLGVVLALFAASVALALSSTLLFPHWPDSIGNPLHDLVWPLYRSGRTPYSIGHTLGLPGALALAPPLLAALALVLWPARAAGRLAPAVAAAALLFAALPIANVYRLDRRDPARAGQARAFIERIWEPR